MSQVHRMTVDSSMRIGLVGRRGGSRSPALWTATVTYRHDNTIRIISVRRARRNEEEKFVQDDDR